MIKLKRCSCCRCGKQIIPNLKWTGKYDEFGGGKLYEIVYARNDYRWYNRHSKWYEAEYDENYDPGPVRCTLDNIDTNGIPFTIESTRG